MVQEINYENNFATMFHSSRQGVNAYSPGGAMHGLPFGYGGPQHPAAQPAQYSTDYSGYPEATPTANIPQSSGSPSPTSWPPSSMYHPQQQTTSTASRHTPTAIEDWHSHQQSNSYVTSNGLPVGQNGGQSSGFSYRPTGLHQTPFSNMPPELGHYVQATPGNSGNMVVGAPTNQSPSPNSGGSHQGGMGHSPVSRQSRGPFEWMKRPSYPNGPTTGKTRTKDKYRIVYSEYQKVELEKEYLYSKYITIQRKAELARSIGLSERQVKIWFQNRRAKERKQKRKREDAMAAVQSPDAHSGSECKDIEPIKVEPSPQDYMNPQVHMHPHLTPHV